MNRVLVKTRQGIGTWSFGVQVSLPSEHTLAARSEAFDPDALTAFALTHEGNPERGRALFFDPKGVGCVKCHAAGGMGTANIGPDLTGLALKYSKGEIITSVLKPSERIATGYQPLIVAKDDGQVLTGLVREETDTHIDLVDAEAKVTRVAKANIDESRVGDVSIMPTGLIETLSAEEFNDLIAYLNSLRSAPATTVEGP